MSPKPPFPMILPRRQFLLSVSVSIHPSGSGQGKAFFLGAINVSKLYLPLVLTDTDLFDFPFENSTQIKTDEPKIETETVPADRYCRYLARLVKSVS